MFRKTVGDWLRVVGDLGEFCSQLFMVLGGQVCLGLSTLFTGMEGYWLKVVVE